ncbi:MAG: hypothetical protein ABI359_06270 [Ginsengibacter sp.]
MEVDNLKYDLLDKLISIEDHNLLEKVNSLIGDIDINKTIFKITDDQKKMLSQSEKDILNSDLVTDEKLNEDEDKWLNR